MEINTGERIRLICIDTPEKGEEYYFFQLSKEDLLNEQALLFLRNYHLKRSEKGIHVKGLAIRQARSLMAWAYKLPHTQVRYLSEFTPTGLVIYKNKVIQLDWKNMDVPRRCKKGYANFNGKN